MECSVSVGEARQKQGMSPQLLEKLLGGPGSEKGIGERVWALLHGVDPSEVKSPPNVNGISGSAPNESYEGCLTNSFIRTEKFFALAVPSNLEELSYGTLV